MASSYITLLMPLGTILQFFVPRWLALLFAHLGGRIAYRFNPSRRKLLLENCRHILGPDIPRKLLERTARQTFINLAINYADLMRTPVLKKGVIKLVEFDPTYMNRTLAQKKGAILVTAHIGNWDLAGVFMAALGYPLSAVVEQIPRGWTKTFNRYRCATNMETIPISDLRAMTRAIHHRRILTLVADRDLTKHGILCPAFDARRSFPKGPAAYSLKYKIPLVIGYFVAQNKPGHPPYLSVIDPQLQFKPTGQLHADIASFTRLIASRLNEIIRSYPDQWFVFQTGWQ